MTETGALMAMSAPLRGEVAAGYIGEAMPDTDIAAFTASGERLPPGETGELRLRHRHVMIEYYRDPEASELSLRDGWVCSGDRGRVDAGGGVFFDGRIKNVIKRSGENISAEEVETALLTLPYIRECLVFGVPDAIRSEEVAACLYINVGHEFDAGGLLAALGRTLSRYKLPRFLVNNSEPLPRLGNGKLDRRNIIAAFDRTRAWDREAGRH